MTTTPETLAAPMDALVSLADELAQLVGADKTQDRFNTVENALLRAQAAQRHSTDDDYQHFLSYSGLIDAPLLKYAYFHGANDPCDKPAAQPRQADEVMEALRHLVHNVKATRKRPDLGLAMVNAELVLKGAQPEITKALKP